jgi:ribonuclease P/MRP protein subunit POP7
MADSAIAAQEPDPQAARKPSTTMNHKTGKSPSSLLTDIKFERKNKPQPRLPPNHTIKTRPINHPPIAAPYAGPDVRKVVYVSRTTPIMAAVKRVKKLLEQAEKRNLQREGVLGTRKRSGTGARGQSKNVTKQEEVLVKASGRAIEQAARVGEWFKRHAEDGDGGWVVTVKPTSVKVVDDIVEEAPMTPDDLKTNDDDQAIDPKAEPDSNDEKIDGPPVQPQEGISQTNVGSSGPCKEEEVSETADTAKVPQSPKRKKRKRPMYGEDDVPEARTRFVNAIEIAISLKA